RGLDVAERRAGGDIGQEPVGGVTEAATHGRKPAVAGLATGRAAGGGRPLHAAPIDVAFGADDGTAVLVIVADGAAREGTRKIEAAGRVPRRASKAAAAV